MSGARQIDVARAAGVSQATVSTVLGNGADLGRISEHTQRRVREVAHDLGYRIRRQPVPAPGAVGHDAPPLLGVHTFERMLPTSESNYYFEFLSGIEEQAGLSGANLLLFTAASRDHGTRSVYHGGSNSLASAAGSLLLGHRANRDDLMRLSLEGYPFVYVGRRELPDHSISYVGGDYRNAVGGIVGDLVTMGHRRFGYIGEETRDETQTERWEGYRDALERFGLPIDPPVYAAPSTLSAAVVDSARDAGTTVLLVESLSLLRVLVALTALRGIQIPDDLSVVLLVDDSPADLAPLRTWATLQIPRREIGRQAVRLLMSEVAGSDGSIERQLVLPCTWTLEGSTGPPSSRAAAGGPHRG